MPVSKDFAAHCCELLGSVGPCKARPMFGGAAIQTDGLTFGLVADLGQGEMLYLKTNADSQARFEAAGCRQFLYPMRGELKGMGYFTAPDEAMESPAEMLPWARLALQAALQAQALKLAKKAPARTRTSSPKAAKAKAATGRPKRSPRS